MSARRARGGGSGWGVVSGGRRKRLGTERETKEDRERGFERRKRKAERRKKRAGASIKLCAVGELNPDLILGRDES